MDTEDFVGFLLTFGGVVVAVFGLIGFITVVPVLAVVMIVVGVAMIVAGENTDKWWDLRRTFVRDIADTWGSYKKLGQGQVKALGFPDNGHEHSIKTIVGTDLPGGKRQFTCSCGATVTKDAQFFS